MTPHLSCAWSRLFLVMACVRCGASSDELPAAGATQADAGAFADADGRDVDGDSTHDTGSGPDATGGEAGAAGNRSRCKRGVAYGHHSVADLAALASAVSWWYDWAPVPDDALASGAYRQYDVEFVPMVWGGSFDADQVAAEIPGGAVTLLGFNEPNFFSQANLSPAQAAALWPQVEQIADQRNLELVSPAVNYCGGGCHDTDPVRWLDDFFAACSGCRVDAIAVHVYVGCNPAGANHAQWLIEKVERYKAEFTHPIWVTEFACDDASSMQEQVEFLRDAVTWLENEPRVVRYAWFSGRADNMKNVDLLGGDGLLTELGNAYVSLPQDPECIR